MKQGNAERIRFLCGVIAKDLSHLDYSIAKIKKAHFDLEAATNLDQNPDLGETVEAFTSRFTRLQDTLGDKLLPAWLTAVGETRGTALDNLDKAEKFGLLNSVDDWMALRFLRNQLVHEYLESAQEKLEAINACLDGVSLINAFAKNLISDIEARKLI